MPKIFKGHSKQTSFKITGSADGMVTTKSKGSIVTCNFIEFTQSTKMKECVTPESNNTTNRLFAISHSPWTNHEEFDASSPPM
jgi:hypothetical protein